LQAPIPEEIVDRVIDQVKHLQNLNAQIGSFVDDVRKLPYVLDGVCIVRERLNALEPGIRVQAVASLTRQIPSFFMACKLRFAFVNTLYDAVLVLEDRQDSATIPGLNEMLRLQRDMKKIHVERHKKIGKELRDREIQLVPDVARKYNITEPLAISHLELIALHGPSMQPLSEGNPDQAYEIGQMIMQAYQGL
jgi:hypothetical protein